MKRAGRIVIKFTAFLLMLIALYILAALVGSVIPVNTNTDRTAGEVTIFLRTNGVHTSIVAPVSNEYMDWTKVVDFEHTRSGRTDFEYIDFGWGDLEFYENTPSWSDLTLPVAYRALFEETPAALNVEFYEDISENENTVAVRISPTEYEKITTYILQSFETNTEGNILWVSGLHYNDKDAFYKAKRHMNIFYTCNTWTNNGLKEAGLRACLWTPFDKGIFYQYR